MDLYEQVCRWCNAAFVICKACFRGQRYCSAACQQASRQKQLEAARRRYESGSRGRQSNRARQGRFRIRRCLEELDRDGAKLAKVTDRSSHPPEHDPKLPADPRRTAPESANGLRAALVRGPEGRAAGLGLGRCQCCGSEGIVLRVPAGWVRRRHRFMPPPLWSGCG